MGPQKKKDLMSDAFDSFWQSGNHQVSTKERNYTDEAFDSLWGRNQYQPNRSAPVVVARQPVQFQQNQSPQGLTQAQHYDLIKQQQAQRYELMKQRMEMQEKLRQRRPQNNSRTNAFIGSLIKGTAKTAASIGKAGYGKVNEQYKKTEYYKKLEESRERKDGLEKLAKERRQEQLKEIRNAPTVAYKKLKNTLEKGKEMAKAEYNKKYNN